MPLNPLPHVHSQVICANMLVRKNDRYLMLKRSMHKRYAPGFFMPVGGKVEPGENPYAAAVRELQEEAGITVKNVRLEAVILEIEPVKGEPYDWTVFHFSGDYDEGELHSTEEGELNWVTREELLAGDLFPSFRSIIEHVLNPNDGTLFATIGYDNEKKEIVKREVTVCAL